MEKRKEQMDLESSNKLIAEFMGFVKQFPNLPNDNQYYYPFNDNIFDESLYTTTLNANVEGKIYSNICIREVFDIKDAQFHKSWGWLVPVYSKIMKSHEDSEERFKLQIDFELAVYENRVDLTHESIVEYLTWYNKQKK
jgi:hypothetical protein